MRALRSSVVLAVSSLALVVSALSTPASTQSDTTPPQLVSLSLSPETVDTSSGSVDVVVTAVITDDLSGFFRAKLEEVGAGVNTYTYFENVSGDTYAATITFPQDSDSYIFRDWLVYLIDNVGNKSWIDGRDLLDLSINVAVGVNAVAPAYSRGIYLAFHNSRAIGSIAAAAESGCWWDVPVILQRKTSSGRKEVGEGYANYFGAFRFPVHKKGKYRVTATEIGLGTPAVTTCLKASKIETLK